MLFFSKKRQEQFLYLALIFFWPRELKHTQGQGEAEVCWMPGLPAWGWHRVPLSVCEPGNRETPAPSPPVTPSNFLLTLSPTALPPSQHRPHTLGSGQQHWRCPHQVPTVHPAGRHQGGGQSESHNSNSTGFLPQLIRTDFCHGMTNQKL